MIWCHACQKETTISLYSFSCAACGSSAIEKSEDANSAPN